MSDYNGILLEDINHKFDAIMEGQAAMANVPGDIAVLKEKTTNIETRLTTMEQALTDTNREFRQHAVKLAAGES